MSQTKSKHPLAIIVGKRIQELRLKAEETQHELATRVQMERSTIANYENGNIVPPLPVLKRIASHYRQPVDSFYETGAPLPPAAVEEMRRINQFLHSTDGLPASVVTALLTLAQAVRDALQPVEESSP